MGITTLDTEVHAAVATSAGHQQLANGCDSPRVRRPGGQVTGTVMRQLRLVIDPPHLSADQLGLLAVAYGTPAEEVAAQYARKAPQRVLLAYAPDGQLVGHAALRLNGCLPDGALLPRPLSWEVSLVAVRPGYRGCGIATRMVTELLDGLRPGAGWAATDSTGPAAALASSLGWAQLPEHEFTYPSGTPGAVWVPATR